MYLISGGRAGSHLGKKILMRCCATSLDSLFVRGNKNTKRENTFRTDSM